MENFHLRGWIGLILIAIFWPLNWLLPGTPTAYLFFPLWLGFILTVDALVYLRTGTSIWSRSRRQFAWLFPLSAPAWWIFEIINRRTQNWEYLGSEIFSKFEYVVLCTVAFSTVMPAVFEAAELAASFNWINRIKTKRKFTWSRVGILRLFGLGIVLLALLVVWPRYCYPFVWLSLVLIIDPINALLGRPSLLHDVGRGHYRRLISLGVGAVICGFFWELWNFYSYPKWIYHTPGAEFLYVFKMPLLGYLGYIPFAWELFALKNLVYPSLKLEREN